MPDAPVISPTAPAVTTPTAMTLYLVVYDGVNKTKSAQVTAPVTVTPPGSGENYPDYKEGTAYKDGDIVTNQGKNYKCKPWPYTAWCAGAANTYGPGTGRAWEQAWDEVQ